MQVGIRSPEAPVPMMLLHGHEDGTACFFDTFSRTIVRRPHAQGRGTFVTYDRPADATHPVPSTWVCSRCGHPNHVPFRDVPRGPLGSDFVFWE